MPSQLNLSRQLYLLLQASSGIALGFLFACSHATIHKDLWDDPSILRKSWTIPTHGPFEAGDHGTEYSNPVLIKNTLFFGNQSTGLMAFYPKQRKKRWEFPVPGGVISELGFDNENLYFTGKDGFFYSIQQETRNLNWKYSLRNPIASRPTVQQGRVFILTSDDTLHALDAGTGKSLWFYRRRSHPTAKIYGASQPLVLGKSEVIVGLSDGFLVSLSYEDGQLKREKKLHFGAKFTDVVASPVLENGVIYIPSYDGSLYALRQDNWDTVWKIEVGGSKSVEIENEVLYLPSSEGAVYSVQKTTGRVLWKFALDQGSPTQLIRTEKYIIFGSSQNYLYVLDKLTGKGLFRYHVGSGSGFYGSPAYDPANKNVYFLSASGNLHCFKIKDSLPEKPHGRTTPYRFLPKI